MFPPPKLRKTPFLQFRAGKMKYSNGIVTPDPQKGYLSFLRQSGAVIEVAWTGVNSEVESIYVWKNTQVSVSFVQQCTTGRVLLFKVSDAGVEKLYFFWLQDKSDARDAEYLTKLKEAFPGRAPTSNASQTVQLEDFKKILASISGNNNVNDVRLSELVSSSKVADAVKSDTEFFKTRLQSTLPEELVSSGEFLDQIRNPQVFRAAATLEVGLKNPETCKELCKMYGLPETTVGVSGFLSAIMKQAKKPDGQ